MPDIPPTIGDNFDDDNNQYDDSNDGTSEPIQSHYNLIDLSDNDESLVTPKTCGKKETQATKRHAFG